MISFDVLVSLTSKLILARASGCGRNIFCSDAGARKCNLCTLWSILVKKEPSSGGVHIDDGSTDLVIGYSQSCPQILWTTVEDFVPENKFFTVLEADAGDSRLMTKAAYLLKDRHISI